MCPWGTPTFGGTQEDSAKTTEKAQPGQEKSLQGSECGLRQACRRTWSRVDRLVDPRASGRLRKGGTLPGGHSACHGGPGQAPCRQRPERIEEPLWWLRSEARSESRDSGVETDDPGAWLGRGAARSWG